MRSRSSSVSTGPSTSTTTGPGGSLIFRTRGSTRCLHHQGFHLAHRLAHADEYGAADDGVADVQLAHAAQRSDGLDIEVVERVAGVEAHAKAADRIAGALDALELCDHLGALGVAALRVEGVCIGPGVDLAHRGANARRGLDLPQLGVDENRNHDARVLEPLHGAGDAFLVAHDVE